MIGEPALRVENRVPLSHVVAREAAAAVHFVRETLRELVTQKALYVSAKSFFFRREVQIHNGFFPGY